MGSRLSTLATWVRGSNLTGGHQPAKLPSFGGYSLETLPYLEHAAPLRTGYLVSGKLD